MEEKSPAVIIPITAELVADITNLHFESFRGFMNTRIGRRYVCSFIDWFRRQDDGIAFVALSEREVVGYVVGAPLGYQRRMNRDLLAAAALGMITHPWIFLDASFRHAVGERMRILLGGKITDHAEPKLPLPTMSLVGIGVSTKMRGHGVGIRLMEAFEVEARARRMRSLRLSVRNNNDAARKLYERHGWMPYPRPGKEIMYYSLVFPESSS